MTLTKNKHRGQVERTFVLLETSQRTAVLIRKKSNLGYYYREEHKWQNILQEGINHAGAVLLTMEVSMTGTCISTALFHKPRTSLLMQPSLLSLIDQ